ncbi:exonuclease [Methanocella sp. CWC-04]|uniref:Exonuclease n=2 Tax=Methanooceanicella nereidis TaxID=2052831 RepID=A0AAP2RGL9_9EURY|nr:exonuclease [Methanocella sp. CWC-04]
MPSWIYDDDYRDGIRVKKKYLEKFDGIKLEDAISGEILCSEQGDCFIIKNLYDFKPFRIDKELARKRILSNLQLLRGIGFENEGKLKAGGYCSIEDLLHHSKWKEQAKRFIEMLDSGDALVIQEEMCHWLPRSHPLNLYVSAFTGKDCIKAFDIETMGLFSRPIILFGAACIEGDQLCIVQYLARNIEEEPAALSSFCSLIGSDPLLSYNGRSFDVPYINQRRWYYDIGDDIRNTHFDMLPFARRAFKGTLPDTCLKTVEKYLFGHERMDDVPGALVPEFYEEYLKTGNPGPLVPIIEHNKQDLLMLMKIFSSFCEDECKDERC